MVDNYRNTIYMVKINKTDNRRGNGKKNRDDINANSNLSARYDNIRRFLFLLGPARQPGRHSEYD